MSFAYDTLKYVHIKDARLACLRYFFLLAILVYVLVFEMWAFGGYLKQNSVVGVVRFSLQQPTVDNCDPFDQNLKTCRNNFDALDTLPYCTQSSENRDFQKRYPGSKYPCKIYEATNAQLISEKAIAVITRVSVTNQTLICTPNDMSCPKTYNNTSSEYRFYVAQSEEFTIMIDHTAVGSLKLCI